MRTKRSFFWGAAVLAGWLVPGAVWPGRAWGQTHKVMAPETVVRAVGVYEWTGDMKKPTASRLIPVTLFLDGKLEDAGVYLARPIPFALLTGNVYELQEAGLPKGLLDLVYARRLNPEGNGGDVAYDDGWFGYGSVQPLPVKRKVALKAANTRQVAKIQGPADTAVGDPDRPTMVRRHPEDGSSQGSGSGTGSGGTAKDTSGKNTSGKDTSKTGPDTSTADTSVPADDPDRPVLHRPADRQGGDAGGQGSTTGTSAGGQTGSGSSTDSTTAKNDSGGAKGDAGTAGQDTGGGAGTDDPDRPTLKRRTPEEAKKKGKHQDEPTVTGVASSLNNDPDRPNLHRGKPASAMTAADLPKLTGMPKDLHQMVAVSDAATREPHDFVRPFTDDKERAEVLGKMEALARTQLTAYETKNGLTPAAAVTGSDTKALGQTGSGSGLGSAKSSGAKGSASARSTKTGVKSSGSSTSTHHSAHGAAKGAAAAPVVEALADEDLKGYVLSYGGDPTYVFTAHTVGTGAGLRYVTVVAQEDSMGQVRGAIQSVTDAAHLDRAPQMKLVDAVDVEASNRASLLFELREQGMRQFGMYRVIGGRAEQIFLTGTTQ